MVMIFTLLLRMTEAGIKARTFPEIGISIPYSLIVIGHCIRDIKNTYAICPDSGMPQTNSGGGIIMNRMARDFENEILIGRNIRISYPRTDAVAGDAGATYISISRIVLNSLNIR